MTDSSFDMPKTYDFTAAEQRLYDWWEENGWFKPEAANPDAEPFVISIPPPNVTGVLHQGHALFVTLEDLMIRYQRMPGRAALWVPGTDHAGIATQLQVERKLRERRHQPRGHRPREVPGGVLGLERQAPWRHRRPTAAPGRELRLGARALHHGRGPRTAPCTRPLCACIVWA